MMSRYLLGAAALVGVAGAAQAAPVYNAGNGHYYELVQNGLGFDDALAAAAASSYDPGTGSLQGYLATVTSQSEQDFIYNNVTSSATWFAGTDRDAEGVWKWVAGPESGQTFWDNGTTLTYANWSAGEPNNCCSGEHLLWGNWNGSAWNDIGPTSLYYVVEYGGFGNAVPEPATWAMMIGGLGLAGAAIRRRRTAPRVTFA